jgi:RNA-binding protein
MEEAKPLSSAEKKELRGIAQRLKPQVRVGKQGLSDSVLGEIETALTGNGLIKIRFEGDRATVRQFCQEIPEKTQSEYIGGVGRVGLFFREMKDGTAL